MISLFFLEYSEYDQEIPNHKPQTNLWHREEDPLNHQEAPTRQTKQQTSPLCPIKMITKLELT